MLETAVGQSKSWADAISQISDPLGNLGMEKLAASVMLGAQLMGFVGTLREIYLAYQAKLDKDIAATSAEVAGLTAANATNPYGWGKIALAAGAAATASFVCTYTITSIIGDMQSDSGQTATAQQTAAMAEMTV